MDSYPRTETIEPDLNVILDGKALYSRYRPRYGAQRGLPPVQEKCLYIAASPLLGYGLEYFALKLPQSSYILAIEQDQRLVPLTQKHAAQWLGPRITLLVQPSLEALDACLKKLGTTQFDTCLLLTFNQGYQLHKVFYDRYWQFCRQFLYTQKQNQKALQSCGERWLTHIIQNIAFLPWAQAYRVQPTNEPFVVVGAGESLENNLADLKKYRTHFRLMAVDTALPCLLSRQITPDLVIVVESSYHNLQDFIPFSQVPCLVLADMTSLPAQQRLFKNNLSFFITRFAPIHLLDRLARHTNLISLPALGSVGIVALGMALKLTKGPIFFTGLDFSFRLGQNHARGAYSHLQLLRGWHRLNPHAILMQQLKHSLIPQKNGKGETIFTDDVLLNYAYIASQGDKERLFALTREGLSLGYQRRDMSALSPLKSPWNFAQKAQNVFSGLSGFIQKEIGLLENFLQTDINTADVDYIFLGYNTLEYQQSSVRAIIRARAEKLLAAWRRSLFFIKSGENKNS